MLENQGFYHEGWEANSNPPKKVILLSLGQVVHDKIHLTENLGL